MKEINLAPRRPGPWPVLATALALALVVGAAAYLGAAYRHAQERLLAASGRLQEVEARLVEAERRQLSEAEAAEKAGALARLSRRAWAPRLRALSRAIPAWAQVTLLAAGRDGGRLGGLARSMGEVSQLAAALGRTEAVQAVRLVQARTAADGALEFELAITWKG